MPVRPTIGPTVPQRTSSRLPLLATVVALAVGLLAPVSAAAAATTTTFSGSAANGAWITHDVEVTEQADLTVRLQLSAPVRVNLYVYDPSGSLVAYDRETTQDKTVLHADAAPGTWRIGLSVKGATDYTATVTQAPPPPPPPPPAAARTVGDAPAPVWQTDGRVREIIRVGDQLWLAGDFRRIRPPGTTPGHPQEVARRGVAVLDATTGAPLPLDPRLDGDAWAVAASPDGATVYVGGDFSTAAGVARKRAAAFRTSDGSLTGWDPRANSLVEALAVRADGTVFAGGYFSWIGRTGITALAALDGTTGVARGDWRPTVGQVQGMSCPPRCRPHVAELVLADGRLWVGGHFGVVNGQTRTNGAALDPMTGSLHAWDPNAYSASASTQPSIVDTIVPVGDRVVVCGDWKTVHGQISTNVGLTTAAAGTPVPGWRVTTDGGTPSCAVREGVLYLGGHFHRVGTTAEATDGIDRLHLAAIELATAAVLPWNPGADSPLGVYAMQVDDSGLRTGGDFANTGGTAQQGLAFYPYP